MSVIKRLETVYNLLASRKVYLCEYELIHGRIFRLLLKLWAMTTGLAPSKQSFILTASYVNIKSNNNHLTRPRRGSDFNTAPFKMNKVFISIEDIPFYIKRIPYMYNNNRRLVIFKAMSNLHELNKLSSLQPFLRTG